MTISYGSPISLTSVFPRRWKNWLKHSLRSEEIVEYFYQIVGVVADASHTVLPQIHLTPYAAYMQIHPNLLGVRDTSHNQTRSL